MRNESGQLISAILRKITCSAVSIPVLALDLNSYQWHVDVHNQVFFYFYVLGNVASIGGIINAESIVYFYKSCHIN